MVLASRKWSLKNLYRHTDSLQPLTWGFMQVGLDKLNISKLQSQALVRAGQTSLGFCS
jgi:hypothetical protein